MIAENTDGYLDMLRLRYGRPFKVPIEGSYSPNIQILHASNGGGLFGYNWPISKEYDRFIKSLEFPPIAPPVTIDEQKCWEVYEYHRSQLPPKPTAADKRRMKIRKFLIKWRII